MPLTTPRAALLGFGASLLSAFALDAQVIVEPTFFQAADSVTIFFDTRAGDGGLAGFDGPVYLHSGVITPESSGPSDWQFVPMEWGTADTDIQLSPVEGEPDVYAIGINIPEFYDLPEGTVVEQLALLVRNADGSQVGRGPGGGDIFVDAYDPADGFQLRVLEPFGAFNIVRAGEAVTVRAATSEDAEFQLELNGEDVELGNGRTFERTFTAEAGNSFYVLRAVDGGGTEVRSDVIAVVAPADLPAAPAPAGARYGLTMTEAPGEATQRATFHLFAPEKEFAFVNYGIREGEVERVAQLTPTPDGMGFWTTLDLDAAAVGEGLVYQYVVDGGDAIADPFSELVLDPQNDPFIDEATFPGIPDLPNLRGFATWVRPTPEFAWRYDDYERPAEGDLVIYELLIRDFVAAHDYATVIDSLSYLRRLGVNAIELMPINEFSGNESWGYNPTYHHALDKYYGPPEDFKRLVDSAHALGMAVIVDVVFNQGDGGNPFFGLYSAERAAAADGAGPFFNQTARHPFNVFNDFNHESPYVQAYVGRTLQDWIEEYHVDGYRFDLSKGFTQVDYGDDVGAWGRYDQSRIDILRGYYDDIRAVDSTAYVILEHFAANDEERVLTAAGMFTWGNMHGAYTAAARGQGNNLYGVLPESRGFGNDRLVGYMESHDEERIAYSVRQSGRVTDDYSTRTDVNSLQRIELNSAFFYTLPGAKMLWQFGEYGYDVPIDQNGRTGNKPLLWDLLERPAHRRLFDVTSALIKLRLAHPVFREGDGNFADGLRPDFGKALTLRHDSMDAVVVGNFGLDARAVEVTFPGGGTYYNYFTGDSLAVEGEADADVALSLTLAPSVYRVYTSERLPAPEAGFFTETLVSTAEVSPGVVVRAYPNPVGDVLTVETGGWDADRLRVGLFDVAGARVLDGGLATAGRLELDLGALTRGTYFLVVADEAGRRVTLPVVR